MGVQVPGKAAPASGSGGTFLLISRRPTVKPSPFPLFLRHRHAARRGHGGAVPALPERLSPERKGPGIPVFPGETAVLAFPRRGEAGPPSAPLPFGRAARPGGKGPEGAFPGRKPPRPGRGQIRRRRYRPRPVSAAAVRPFPCPPASRPHLPAGASFGPRLPGFSVRKKGWGAGGLCPRP